MKLWKGLFFCMWHSDKPLTQQRLARDLADLLTVVSGRENFLGFVRAFWQTIAREWSGIDALRMDKFLYLVRCYVGKGFEVVKKKEWEDEELIDAYLDILAAVPLNASEPKIPNGLRYHVIDVYVDELDKVDTERNAPLEKMLEPLKELGEKSLTKPVKLRVKEALEDERLQDWKSEREQDIDEGNDDERNEDFGGFD
jgi:ribosomal RNA-processing protein 1